MDREFKKRITTEKELRHIMGHPNEIVSSKTIDFIDAHCKNFIEKSPFITIASSDLNGNFDVSPKGDAAGFVAILNDKTLAIPDRPGNKKADTLRNIIQNPNVGLLFLIPGIRETLRVNGEAQIVRDAHILDQLAHKGKKPLFAIIVHVKEAFMHCAKCIIRSRLWTPIDQNPDMSIATLGKTLVDHGKLNMDYHELDAMIREDERTNLY
ncbi:MSMEG_1061 family FMN-dependent PPOX-type flavoprotein [Maribacter flavus]|uniref:Pyridoxamine 5'-phosphate oxidase family protein n=1 Tax=Maribacter flavus TaxID=1658664 RepID=A0A5B2TRK2_9FLAO|nr:MSMEG_1061 family FMN-dependent PPOX-type flavoprotein [Maribacter flavus]KAA2216894.1 pyridoxamine 5'-phosphate oxidase family protein [Maribacter flavus]